MIEEILSRVEQRLRRADGLAGKNRDELLSLIQQLRQDLGLAATELDLPEQLQSVLHFTQASAHEALQPDQDPELLQLALTGLARSVEGFEASHPRLVSIVGAIGQALGNMGI